MYMPGTRQAILLNSYSLKVFKVGGFWRVWHKNCPIIVSVLILALDTATPAGSLAVLRDEVVLGTISTWTGETYCSRMFRQLEFLLGELSLGLEKFDLFAVASGAAPTPTRATSSSMATRGCSPASARRCAR